MNNNKTALDLVLQKRAEVSTFQEPPPTPGGVYLQQQQRPTNGRGTDGSTFDPHQQPQQHQYQHHHHQQYYPQFIQQQSTSAMFPTLAFPSQINAQGQVQFHPAQQQAFMTPFMLQQQQPQQYAGYPHLPQSQALLQPQAQHMTPYVFPQHTQPIHRPYQQQESRIQQSQQPSSSSLSSTSLLSSEEKQIYYCEPCDKEFKNARSYEAHKQTHEKCKHPKCQFTGSKKVVVAHYHATHGLFSGSGYKDIEVEGMKFRVLLGSNEKEIEQWRAERRRKFPTVANIAKKERIREEVTKAGGILPNVGKGFKRLKGEQGQPVESRVESKEATQENMTFDGEKEEEEGDSKPLPEQELKKEEKSSYISPKSIGLKRKPCKFYAQGKCSRGDDCTHSHDFQVKVCKFYVQYGRCNRSKNGRCSFFHDRNAYEEYKKNNPIKGPGGGKGQVICGSISGLKKVLGAKEPSLMSKLLQDQIDAEENKILQSFRFLSQYYSFGNNTKDEQVKEASSVEEDTTRS